MRAPLSWLGEHVDAPLPRARELADRLILAGLEVERVEPVVELLGGPLVVGRVSGMEVLEAGGRELRACRVDVGAGPERTALTTAPNVEAGAHVVVALPGAVLAGGATVGERLIAGQRSDAMLCSEQELGVADGSSGILLLGADAQPGADARALLGLDDEVLDIAVTPDRSYCLSIRGIAREAATACGAGFRDPADAVVRLADDTGPKAGIEAAEGCGRFVLRAVHGFDPAAGSPGWLRRRLRWAGVRSVSLAVDVTNYVMLELGQPLHVYDATAVAGTVTVRRALAGERLTTLDGVTRDLHPDDLVIADEDGAIGLAGLMGGERTEATGRSDVLLIEAAHFTPAVVAAASRRHRLSTEASYRFERGVDPELPRRAVDRAAALLQQLGGGRPAGVTAVGTPPGPPTIAFDAGRPAAVAGHAVTAATTAGALREVGCVVTGDDPLQVTPPSWRPDLTDPADLVEEVLRLSGYDGIPSVLPAVAGGRGLSTRQRARRRVSRHLAAVGLVEIWGHPFAGESIWDALGIPDDDPRRVALRLANPLSDVEPFLRTTLLPTMLLTLQRNLRRGLADVALFEIGQVFVPRAGATGVAPRLGVDRRPTEVELAAQAAALPDQPQHVAAVLTGWRTRPGWQGPGRATAWHDALWVGQTVAHAVGVGELSVHAAERAPWHPGRCAELRSDGETVGYAGELHPGCLERLDLPARTAAVELSFDALAARLERAPAVSAPVISRYPPSTQDVALVVGTGVTVAKVEAALREGAGDLLESLELFDVYTGPAIPPGTRSLAFSLRFRAADRTLTVDEVTAMREAAVDAAARRTGAQLRGV